MQILITGASGFAGQHLVQHIIQMNPGCALHGTYFQTRPATGTNTRIRYTQIDLRNAEKVNALIKDVQPDVIYHLAGQASAARSFEAPWETMEINIRAQMNLLEACRHHANPARIVIVSSAEIYGDVRPEDIPLTEDTPLRPSSPYSVSKATQDLMGYQYFKAYQLPIIRARAFNHLGPGQSVRFVAAAFASQIARIEDDQQDPVLWVGNLNAERDFTDVRDVVRAYYLLAEAGEPGAVYNIASNVAYSIQELLDTLLSLTDRTIDVRLDKSRLRPADIPLIRGDATRLYRQTGWQPSYPLRQTLQDVLDDCRGRVKRPRHDEEGRQE